MQHCVYTELPSSSPSTFANVFVVVAVVALFHFHSLSLSVYVSLFLSSAIYTTIKTAARHSESIKKSQLILRLKILFAPALFLSLESRKPEIAINLCFTLPK